MANIGAIKRAVNFYGLVQQDVRKLSKVGNSLSGKCPFHKDGNASFHYYPQTESWNCFAGCGGGDLIHYLIKRERLGGSYSQQVKQILQLYGRDSERVAQIPEGRFDKSEADKMAQSDNRNKEKAEAIYKESLMLGVTTSLAWDYLTKTRGIDILADNNCLTPCSRFAKSIYYQPRQMSSAIVNGFYDFTDEGKKFRSIQRIFIDKEARKRSERPKRFYGDSRGAISPVWLPEDAERDTIYISEGFEDALSYATLNPQARIFYAGGIAPIGAMSHPSWWRKVVVLCDNDTKEQPLQAYQSVKATLLRKFAVVDFIYPPSEYKDFNEYILAKRGKN